MPRQRIGQFGNNTPEGDMWNIRRIVEALISASSSGGAPTDAQYLVLANDATLTNERALVVGNGLSELDAGAGGAFTLSIGTPSTLSASSVNDVTTESHTHEVDSSSDPQESASILQTDSNGRLILERLNLGGVDGNSSIRLHCNVNPFTDPPDLNTGLDVAIFSNQSNTANVLIQGATTGRAALMFGDVDNRNAGYVQYFNSSDLLEIFSSGDIELGSNNVLIDGAALSADNWVSGTTGWGVSYAGDADFRNITADTLTIDAFISDVNLALAGSQFITKSLGIVSRQFTVPAASASATLYIYDLPGLENAQVFEDNDFVKLRFVDRSGGGLVVGNAWGNVTSYTDLGNGEQSWTFTSTSLSTAGGQIINEGMVALDYGLSGDGWWEVTTLDSAGSPYAQIATWETTPVTSSNYTVHLRLGQLDGITGIGDEWGLWAGKSSTEYILASDQNLLLQNVELRMRNVSEETTILLRPDAEGELALGNPLPTGPSTGGAGFWVGYESGGYQVRIGTATGARMLWDSSQLRFYDGNNSEVIRLESDGDSLFTGTMEIASGGEIVAGSVTLDDTGLVLNSTGDLNDTADRVKFNTAGGAEVGFVKGTLELAGLVTDGDIYSLRLSSTDADGNGAATIDLKSEGDPTSGSSDGSDIDYTADRHNFTGSLSMTSATITNLLSLNGADLSILSGDLTITTGGIEVIGGGAILNGDLEIDSGGISLGKNDGAPRNDMISFWDTLLPTANWLRLGASVADDNYNTDTGIQIRAMTNPSSGDNLFRVLSAGGSERLRVEHDGRVYTTNYLTAAGGFVAGSATGGHKGAGTINVAGDIYKNNTAYTNPDYALEHWVTGQIVQHANKSGASGYSGRMPIPMLKNHIETTFRLPGMTDEPMGAFGRFDWLLEKLEEAYTYIIDLHEHVEKLETV